MSKGNGKIGTSREVMERRVETARDCYNRQRVATAEAVAETFLLYKDTLSGLGRSGLMMRLRSSITQSKKRMTS
jgi:hypothetical protein